VVFFIYTKINWEVRK